LIGYRRVKETSNCIVYANESPVTVHVENGIKYKFDTQQVMFVPGNGTERMRFSRLKVSPNEFVVDMFAGLGYFSVPLTKNNQQELTQLVAIEKKIPFPFNSWKKISN